MPPENFPVSPEVPGYAISPSEAEELQIRHIPPEVFETFNRFIAQKFFNGRARVLQKDIVNALVGRGLNRHQIYDEHWLDVEDAYRKKGWDVVYDKPAYNETYEASFEFKAKKKQVYGE
jgi:hypothetical protein